MIDKNWSRWIFASTSKHFDNNRQSVHMFFEGQDRNTRLQEQYFEFRMDGPYYKELTKNYYQVDLEINILCVVKRDSDNHAIHRLCGIIAQAFTNIIPIYKYGDTDDDDDSLVECFHRRDDRKESIVTSHFGQIDPDVLIMQSCVEAHYRAHLIGA